MKPREQLAWERSIKLGKCDEMMHIRCPGTGVLQAALPVLSLWREEWGRGGRRSPLCWVHVLGTSAFNCWEASKHYCKCKLFLRCPDLVHGITFPAWLLVGF